MSQPTQTTQTPADYRAEKVHYFNRRAIGTRLVRKSDGAVMLSVIGPATRERLFRQMVEAPALAAERAANRAAIAAGSV